MTAAKENQPSSEPEDFPSEEGLTRQQFSTSSSFTEDKMIRVSVYWYTRSLKKHRGKTYDNLKQSLKVK